MRYGESRQKSVGEVVTGGHTMGSATSRLWGSTRMRMVQLDQFEKYDRGGSIPAPDSEEGVPSELTQLSLASPRRVGWVTAGKGQRRAKFGGRR